MPKTQSPLTLFILSQPETLSAKEVADKAREAGFSTNPDAVKQTRRRTKERGAKLAKKSTLKSTKPTAKKKATSKKPSPKTGMSKSDFIRRQPLDLPAAEVVAKAKAAGVELKSGLVYEVRATLRRKKGAKKATLAMSPPAKSTHSKPSAAKAGGSKSDFIRRQPASLSAAEVIAKAKEAGLKIEPDLVYKVRGARKKADKGTARAKAAVAPTVKTVAPAPKAAPKKAASHAAPRKVVAKHAASKPATNGSRKSPTSAEDLLRAVASEIGLARAIGVLEEQRRQVLKMLGG